MCSTLSRWQINGMHLKTKMTWQRCEQKRRRTKVKEVVKARVSLPPAPSSSSSLPLPLVMGRADFLRAAGWVGLANCGLGLARGLHNYSRNSILWISILRRISILRIFCCWPNFYFIRSLDFTYFHNDKTRFYVLFGQCGSTSFDNKGPQLWKKQ